MAKNKFKKILFILLLISLLSFLILYYYAEDRKNKELELPRAHEGEIIKEFNLQTPTGKKIDKSTLSNATISLLYIFNNRCPSCDHNINFWRKLDSDFKKTVDIYGIIFSKEVDITTFSDQKRIKFNLYLPLEKEKFLEGLNVKYNLSQTVLLNKDKIIFSKAGDLNIDDYFKIKKIIKENLK